MSSILIQRSTRRYIDVLKNDVEIRPIRVFYSNREFRSFFQRSRKKFVFSFEVDLSELKISLKNRSASIFDDPQTWRKFCRIEETLRRISTNQSPCHFVGPSKFDKEEVFFIR